MTDKTTTQNLTRTTQSDDPKQMAAYLKSLATEADQRMRSHFYDLGRSQYRPLAVIRRTVPFSLDIFGASTRVGFDTVDVDTAGLVDLSAFDYGITLRETGFWACGGYIVLTSFGNANADVYLTLSGVEGSNVTRDGGHGGTGVVPVSVFGHGQVTVPNTTVVSMTFGFTGSSSTFVTTVQAAHLWAYKVRDL
jgi:hypothetical protein